MPKIQSDLVGCGRNAILEGVVKQVLILVLAACAARAQTAAIDYSNLRERQVINGFRTAAVYLDDAGRPMGARFTQIRSGFTLDLLSIQSAPQGFIWVKTYPTSNMGEPHTQEHLLLGKGTRGRALGSIETMSLVTSSAFTMQWMTCFHFFTAAGPEVFFEHFERMFEALKFPNYTDEEIRREVRNFGVTAGPDSALRLEEQGTVYNEMTTSMDQPAYRLFHRAALAIYGPDHPLAFSAGGLPEALRVIQPADIRRFHDAHYFGGNMGMIAALPKEVTIETALAKIDEALDRVEPRHPVLPVMTEKDLPAPRPAPVGRIEYVPYPSQNAQQPSSVLLVWPAEHKLANRDFELLNLFLDNFAGEPDTNLYARLVNSRTREADFGIQGINAWADADQGNPVYVMFRDMPPAGMDDRNLGLLRSKVIEELKRVAAWPDGSADLKAFNQRLKSRILQRRRELARFVNSPPGFGLRGIGSDWVTQLVRLNKEPGFRKSLTEKEDLDAIEAQVGGSGNIWRDALAAWKLTDVTPWIEAAKPDPPLIGQQERERVARLAAEIERLERQYGVTDDQAALRRYKAGQDAASGVIEAAAREITPPRFIENPPLGLDDSLQYTARKLASGVPLVASTFDSMTGATVGLALRLNSVRDEELVYLSLLPELLTRSGVIENGNPVPYPEMAERLRSEILGLNANYRVNPLTNRYELVIRGSGSNAAETERALEWMKLALLHPDWRPENLPRMRDLVEETLGSVHNRMQGPEETWVENPARAWRFQDRPLLLATSSFLTREHNLFRLKWELKSGGEPDLYQFLDALAVIGGARSERLRILSAVEQGEYPGLGSLSASSKKLAADAAHDLEMLLPEIPDSSLAADWAELCHGMRRDLEAGPEKSLAELDKLRRSLLARSGARIFFIGSTEAQNMLARSIEEFPSLLENGVSRTPPSSPKQAIAERLRARDPQATHPVFVGLLNPNSQGGVFVNSVPGAGYHDTSPDSLLDFLASLLYAGHGAHSIFMKTWSAGLAYSNGIRIRPLEARVNYYAERTPLLPQTLEFVIGELKNARPDPALVDYAIAGAFDDTRSALSFEERGEAMAEDLADGLTPEVVARFHRAVLDLRKRPDLADELFRRMPKVYERVLPGMGIHGKDVPGAVYFVIGPEKQLSAYEQYLKKVEGPDTRLFRLYPRDFWVE
jgi:Zn-dependent M16 (insulinase) family peptidase